MFINPWFSTFTDGDVILNARKQTDDDLLRRLSKELHATSPGKAVPVSKLTGDEQRRLPTLQKRSFVKKLKVRKVKMVYLTETGNEKAEKAPEADFPTDKTLDVEI